MISYSAPGGSVGPHADHYDVFLLQTEGRKKWQLAERFDNTILADCELEVLDRFDAEVEWVLEPGDVLYLPPGIAHHGIALESGSTCSIGMRAPSAADLMQALGEWLAEHEGGGDRYQDPEPLDPLSAGEISATALLGLSRLIQGAVADSDQFGDFAGEFIFRFRLGQEPLADSTDLTADELNARLLKQWQLQPSPWARLCWFHLPGMRPGTVRLFAAGSKFTCSRQLAILLCQLTDAPVCIGHDSLPLSTNDLRSVRGLLGLGYLTLLPPN